MLGHARRKFWEAAVTIKDPGSREALLRIQTMFKLEQEWADLPPKQRHDRRQRITRPMLDEFFAWAGGVFDRVKGERGPVATAFGYAIRQRVPLLRFLEDGRLKPDNNAAERALRGSIAVGRKAWLFFGSDDHAQAAANIFSLVASCELHGLDVERYLADVIRLLPLWPWARYLELAPRYWARTRARLDPRELELPIGPCDRAAAGRGTVSVVESRSPSRERLCITRRSLAMPASSSAYALRHDLMSDEPRADRDSERREEAGDEERHGAESQAQRE